MVQGLSVAPGTPIDRGPLAGLGASAAGVAAAALLVRRVRAPQPVLAAVAVLYLVQLGLRGPVLPLALTVAVVAAARTVLADDGRVRRPVVTAVAGAVAVVVLGPLAVGRPAAAAPFAVLLLAAAVAGELLAVGAARDAERRRESVHAERLRLARDLHDVVGHGMSAIAVQAGAGRVSLAAGDADAALRAFAGIEAAGRSVLREARWMVSLLRDDGERRRLSDVPALVDDARRSGLDVVLDVEGPLDTVPDDVGEAVYRLVQEALTNVLRHAGSAATTVRLRVADEVVVDVVDRTDEPAAGADPGNGLRGMHERVAAVRGTVAAGPLDDGRGWSVQARLPVVTG
ncbi:MAG: hypothetical protein QOC98_1979 [Frankiaceae bacterium]|nr:hypothetical protein [Frankiaceae bacterium]